MLLCVLLFVSNELIKENNTLKFSDHLLTGNTVNARTLTMKKPPLPNQGIGSLTLRRYCDIMVRRPIIL